MVEPCMFELYKRITEKWQKGILSPLKVWPWKEVSAANGSFTKWAWQEISCPALFCFCERISLTLLKETTRKFSAWCPTGTVPLTSFLAKVPILLSRKASYFSFTIGFLLPFCFVFPLHFPLHVVLGPLSDICLRVVFPGWSTSLFHQKDINLPTLCDIYDFHVQQILVYEAVHINILAFPWIWFGS